MGRAFITKLSRLDFILEARRAIGRFLRRRGMIYQKKPERANDEAEEVVQGRPLARPVAFVFLIILKITNVYIFYCQALF